MHQKRNSRKVIPSGFPEFSIRSELYGTIAMAEIASGEKYISIDWPLPEHGSKHRKAWWRASRIKRFREGGFVFGNVDSNERLDARKLCS